jgi:hypothetical protein
MPDNPICTFFQFLVGDIPDQLGLGELRWFTVALYWAFLIGMVAVAYTNWRMDATQRTAAHVSVFSMRILSAGMWYLGTLWKLPLPVSAGFSYWLGQTAHFTRTRRSRRCLSTISPRRSRPFVSLRSSSLHR